ncbi:MAG: PQQ-binding-like beta-propeller repeat protein [Phycisphaerales bacterium]
MTRFVCLIGAVAAGACTVVASAQDWSNSGGNAGRNGLSGALGPVSSSDVRWTVNSGAVIAWAPVTLGERVFAIRETGFPTNGGAANDAVVSWNLATGAEQWRVTLPFSGNTSQDWIAWIAGCRDGAVYASRSGNGASVSQVMYALEATTGAVRWQSQDRTTAGAYDGVVFAPNGDLIVADFRNVTRIRATDGATVWRVARLGSVSGNCGGAATANAVFIVDAVPGGHRVKKLSLATGALLYQSPLMSGFTSQNSPFVSPDGSRVYFARSQNNPPVDNLFAFDDTGAALTQAWNRPVRWTTSHEHGIGPDGSIYTFLQDDSFVRLSPVDGSVVNNAGVLSPLGSPNLSAKTAVDASGIVYVSNGWANSPSTNGRLWAFSQDLSQTLFTVNLTNQNNGGPALAADGTLIMADLNGLRAWRSDRTPPCVGDFDGDSDADGDDIIAFFAAWDAGSPRADIDGVNGTDGDDVIVFFAAWDGGC